MFYYFLFLLLIYFFYYLLKRICYPELFYNLYNNLYGLYNHCIVISIVFYVCVYGVVICFKFCSLNSNVCKIIMGCSLNSNFF